MSRELQSSSDTMQSRNAEFDRLRRRSSARRSRPFDASMGKEWVALLRRRDRRAARLQGCQFSRAFVGDSLPGESAVVPRRLEHRGVVRGSRFCLPGRRPGRSGNSDRKKPLSESSDADQTRPPSHQARVAIEATKPHLRAGRIGSCLSDCLVSDLSFDRRSPGQ